MYSKEMKQCTLCNVNISTLHKVSTRLKKQLLYMKVIITEI